MHKRLAVDLVDECLCLNVATATISVMNRKFPLYK